MSHELVGIIAVTIGIAATAAGGLVYVVKSVLPEAHRRGVEIMEKQLTHCQEEVRTMIQAHNEQLGKIIAALPNACKFKEF